MTINQDHSTDQINMTVAEGALLYLRVSVPTPFGLAGLQATALVSVATAGRPTAANAEG
jgi:hypothetical protein